MKSSSKQALGLLALMAVCSPAVSEVRQPHSAGYSGTTTTTGSQMRVGLVLVAANELQRALPAPAQLDFPASPNAVLCSSDAAGYRECQTPFRGRVLLSRDLAGTRCIEGQNWGWREGAVWVDGGCSAVFLSRAAATSAPAA